MLDILYLGLLIDVRLSGYIWVYFEYINKVKDIGHSISVGADGMASHYLAGFR